MTTRNAVIILAASILFVVLLLSRPWKRNSSSKPSGINPWSKPLTRPERYDLIRFLEFKGKSMESILAEAKPLLPDSHSQLSSATSLARSMPREAFPFSDSAKPVNELTLRRFVENIEAGNKGEPSPVDLWRYNLASSGLGVKEIDPELRFKVVPRLKTENFPVKLQSRTSEELQGPVAAADFDTATDRLELISDGGAKMWQLGNTGELELVGLIDAIGGQPGDILRAADFDNDGDADLFVGRSYNMPNSLLRNDGGGSFTDVTIEAGLLTFSDTAAVEWVDYDQDGMIDIVVGNRDHPLALYRQTEVGKFEDIAYDIDLWIPSGVQSLKVADLDNDTYIDFFLSLDKRNDQILFSVASSAPLQWRFEARKTALPLAEPDLVIETLDFDNDGDLDVLTGRRTEEIEALIAENIETGGSRIEESHLRLFQNDGEDLWVEVTDGSGLQQVEDVRSIHAVDLDQDGFEDVFVVTGDMAFNRAFWNRGGIHFREVSRASRLTYLDSPSDVCITDLDSDGAIDIFMADGTDRPAHWLEGEGYTNGWLELDFSHHSPGTKVSLLTRDTDWVLQPIHRTTGALPRLTVGVGYADWIEQIDIYPPQATRPIEIKEKIYPNQRIKIDLSAVSE